MKSQYFVYILKCNDNSYYKGITDDVERRYYQHLTSQCDSTRNKEPIIVFVQVCNNRIEARELEKYLKSGSGREIMRELIGKN